MRILLALILTFGLAAGARAEGERPGDFDYYVMALSWSPNWCALEGDARRSPQCARGTGHGWILHGLWPQNRRGYPSYCQSARRPPSRAMTGAMADIMGTGGLAWHQWEKHGTCTGLSAEDYYALSRTAYAGITRPDVLRKLTRAVTLPAEVVEDAFLEVNPDLSADGITITCRDGRIQEARFCLTRELHPTTCGPDVIRDCRMQDAEFNPVR